MSDSIPDKGKKIHFKINAQKLFCGDFSAILLIYLEVKFDIDGLVDGVHHLESVGTVAVHVSEAVRNTSVGKHEHHLMRRLWS